MPDKITPSESRANLPEATEPSVQLELDFSSPQSSVSIIVDRGVKQQTFVVYKQIICHYSQFFRAAFNSPMLEGQTQEMRLEDVDARIFGFFVHWLYTQSATPPYRRCALIDYAKLYSLGDRFMTSSLKNLAAQLVKHTDPGDDPDSGNSLKDFQHFAYSVEGGAYLRGQAVLKTLDALGDDNIELLIASFPDGMLSDFAVMVSRKLRINEKEQARFNGRLRDFLKEVESW